MDDLEQLKVHHLAMLRHLTTTSLVALGGLLTFLGTILTDLDPKTGVWIAAGLFLFAALTALNHQERLAGEVVRSRGQLEPARRAGRLATYALMAGAGMVTAAMLLGVV
jgi:hypothetical protein